MTLYSCHQSSSCKYAYLAKMSYFGKRNNHVKLSFRFYTSFMWHTKINMSVNRSYTSPFVFNLTRIFFVHEQK